MEKYILNRKDFYIKGSMGQGNKTLYPWVAIMNRNVTTTTQKGLYIVYLFKKDMSGFYITLAQGITNFENSNAKRVTTTEETIIVKALRVLRQ